MKPAFAEALLEPLQAFAGPHHRVYLPFVGASAVLAAVVWALGPRARGASLLHFVFPWRVLLHRSSRFDALWLFVRGAVHALILWPLRLTAVGVMLAVSGSLRDAVGVAPWHSPASRAPVVAAFSLALFLADDFTRYLVHRLMHRVPALWELHKVHHSAEVMTPLTLYRVHPIESALNQLRGVLALGVVTGLFAWAVPGRLDAWSILGVDAIGFVWTVAGANLRHSHVWLSFGASLERVFISPAQHQLHHARDPVLGSSNYGSILALWDWAGGSLTVAAGRRPPRIGLRRSEQNHTLSPLSALVSPLVASSRRIAEALSPRARRSAGESVTATEASSTTSAR